MGVAPADTTDRKLMLLAIALAVVLGFVLSVGCAIVISTRRAASLDQSPTIDLVLHRR